ncbi:MAG: hypothetical protein ACRCVW_01305 [Brevinema sp.]
MHDIQTLYHLFLKHPYLNASLVFDDHDFAGILLKKDIERALKSQDNFLIDKIMNIPKDNLEKLIFTEKPKLKMQIPFISLTGEFKGMMMYDEFVSEFFPHDFTTRLSLQEVFYHVNYPILILNQFNRILYLNKSAEDLLSPKACGEKISNVMLGFEINHCNNDIIIHRQEEQWKLLIAKSQTNFASYSIYQFIQI